MLQAYKYSLLSLLRDKEQVFWSVLFPILLGTFFYFAFGNIMELTDDFTSIPVAVVNDASDGQVVNSFTDLLTALSETGDALLRVEYLDLEEAQALLTEGEIDGIFQIDEEVRLIVSKEGLNQSLLKIISNQYLQRMSAISSIAEGHSEFLEEAIEGINSSIQVNEEITFGTGETNIFIYYFYALLAMTCMNGSHIGLQKALAIQANISPLAARRSISPSKKIGMIINDVLASVTFQFLLTLVSLAYFVFVLNINFGQQLGMVILTCFIGCLMGISFGAFMATLIKGEIKTREGILTGATLFLCALSGLMSLDVRMAVREYAPIVDKINPAILLSDAFYALSVYSNYDRYFRLIGGLSLFTIFFCVASAVVLRRERYDNI